MICRLYTHWSVGLESWLETMGIPEERAAIEFGYYLSAVITDIPGVEETGAWAYGDATAPARIRNGRITIRMHWRLHIPVEPWREWRAEYDRGRPVYPGVRRDALRYFAAELYASGSIAPTDAVMTVTRAREGRTAAWRSIPDAVRVYRPEDRKRATL